MKVIIGGVYQPTLDGTSVKITRQMSDPVPTCALNLVDNTSSLAVQRMQELLILDDQVIPNPVANMLQNPSLNPYTTSWQTTAQSGLTLATVPGGGVKATISNIISLVNVVFQNVLVGSVIPGQSYTLSVFAQGSSTPTNIAVQIGINWFDAGGSIVGSSAVFTGPYPVSTTLTRYSVTGTAPTGAAQAQVNLLVSANNSTNSGVVTFTQAQLEANWFPTIAYPTPYCGPSQTNCQQLPLGLWIRQYRKFAGFVTHAIYGAYHGNVRTIQVDAVGYAWLTGTIFCNDSFTNTADSSIITTLLGKYLLSNGTAMLTTTQVVQGATLSNLQSNWDDLRTIFDNLASQSGFYWTVDYYWNMIYAPPGYFSAQIALICDNSSNPNMVTTFPAYNFSTEMDYTQPGSTILVLGNGSNTAEVIDPSVTAQLGYTSGYTLPSGTSWMRKVSENTLNSVTDCTNRGMAELLQYDRERYIYHVTTNVELIAGQGIQVTSNTDGLNQTTLLIQQVQARWLGTNETLTDEWEYQADLGATNKAATHIISRIFRATTRGTSAPAISSTTLAVLEPLGVVDSTGTGTTVTGYAETIMADTPVAYYRLDEITGTIADDISGLANQGTLHGTITEGAAGLLHSGSDTAMTFDGSTGYISLPTSMIPTGAHAWSLECWVKVASIPASGLHTMMGWGNTTGNQQFGTLNITSNGTTAQFLLSTDFGDITSGNISANTIYHVVGTYDGTSIRLYVNGSLVAGPTAFTLNLTQVFASIGAFNGSSQFCPGTLDEPAFYTFALSATQVSNHYTAGTT